MSNDVDLKMAENYYRIGREKADRAIKEFIKDCKLIVHGGKSVNAFLPDWLERETKDWDVFAKKDAEKYAKELEEKLDKRYGEDFFAVESAVHEGTYRIRNKVTGDVVADITLQDKAVDFKSVGGIRYATLEYHENKIAKDLDDPEKEFRHRKDTETLQRIQIYKKVKRHKDKKGRDNATRISGVRGR